MGQTNKNRPSKVNAHWDLPRIRGVILGWRNHKILLGESCSTDDLERVVTLTNSLLSQCLLVCFTIEGKLGMR